MGVIDAGVNECRNLLGKQKTIEDYFFYEGSIDGFEECKSFRKMADFEKRIEELHFEENREVSKSSLKDELLREYHKIYSKNEKTDYKEVFRIKGVKEQISFVYDKLILYKALLQRHDPLSKGIQEEYRASEYSYN